MYSGKTADIGNCADGIDFRESQFALHMRFFIEQLMRVVKPGCNACIHVQQLLAHQNQHGFIGRRDFRGAVVDLFRFGGWNFHGEFVIPKNPQAMAKRLNLHSLMFATGYRNSRNLAPAVNDYVLIFQKPGDSAPCPALYQAGHKNDGTGWVTTKEWVRDASGVWDDIHEIDVLDGWRAARESDEEKHVCPLQLEVIRRCVRLYTAPGETVLDPFMGIGSTAYVAIEQGRSAVGFELKESYHRQALRNVELAKRRNTEQMGLFAGLESGA